MLVTHLKLFKNISAPSFQFYIPSRSYSISKFIGKNLKKYSFSGYSTTQNSLEKSSSNSTETNQFLTNNNIEGLNPPNEEIYAVLHVSGMHCSSCVGRVEQAIKQALPNISRVDINLTTGKAFIYSRESFSTADAVNSVKEIGYETRVLKDVLSPSNTYNLLNQQK